MALAPPTKASEFEELKAFHTVGTPVVVAMGNKEGVIRYVGETQFAQGTWLGVELLTAEGKNDGSLKGVRYFTCDAKCGVFCRPNQVRPVDTAAYQAVAAAGAAAATVARSPRGQSKDAAGLLLEPDKNGAGAATAGSAPPAAAAGASANLQDPGGEIFKRRRSVDNLRGSIIVSGQSDAFQAINTCVEEVSRLGGCVSRLSALLEGALAREQAALAELAALQPQQSQQQPPAAPSSEALERWLDATGDRLEQRLGAHLQQTMQRQLAEALAQPLAEIRSANDIVSRIRPRTRPSRAAVVV
eukprot:TRINITY_DN16602_c1_g2_i1.p2 TRINITY_DN16602_c1_g2~~TRINITY_DN16602_c1_g2_i1.p2  ORF type:complete len:301 (-),score=82.01 TRINITY_DN16602_c1_g2_i1:80-982(-)